jgi:hypothetical protein
MSYAKMINVSDLLIVFIIITGCPWYLLRPSYGIKGEEEKICIFQNTSPEIFYVVTYVRIDLFFFSIYTVTVEQFTCQLVSLFFINMFHIVVIV